MSAEMPIFRALLTMPQRYILYSYDLHALRHGHIPDPDSHQEYERADVRCGDRLRMGCRKNRHCCPSCCTGADSCGGFHQNHEKAEP